MHPGSFDSTTIYVAPAVPGDRPGTYWFYYVGYKTGHHVNYEPKAGGIGRFLLVVDTPWTEQKNCSLISWTAIESSERPTAVFGQSLSGKSRLKGRIVEKSRRPKGGP